MTTDVELPPLPDWMDGYTIPSDDFEHDGDIRLSERMRDYARTSMEPLIAEIEALRAKAAEHRDGRLAALERAERLVEALRYAVDNP